MKLNRLIAMAETSAVLAFALGMCGMCLPGMCGMC